MRGRNNNNNNNGNRKSPNPLQRSYESNGPDVKVRGTAQHIAEKYLQLARDAQSSGDTVAAENYFQHAEHYYRILLAAQEQMSQQFGHTFPPNRAFVEDDGEDIEEGDDDGQGFQSAPQPERHGGMNGGNGGGYSANGDGDGQPNGNGQRFDRPQGRNQDGRNQDGRNQDRFNNDRNGRRFDRNERRFERGEGGQQGQGGYQPRPDAPRSDIPVGSSEQPEIGAAPVQEERRFERPERTERPERGPRPERRPRREPREVPEADAGEEPAAGLPSFLTNPVRVPIAVAEPAAEESGQEPVATTVEEGEAAPKRTRRRRSPREVMDALGSEADGPAE